MNFTAGTSATAVSRRHLRDHVVSLDVFTPSYARIGLSTRPGGRREPLVYVVAKPHPREETHDDVAA